MTHRRLWLISGTLAGVALLAITLLLGREPAPNDISEQLPATDPAGQTGAPAGKELLAPIQEDPAETTDITTDEGTQDEEATATTEERPEGKKSPDRNDEDYEAIWEVGADRFITVLRRRLDHALDGDLEAARQLSDVRDTCFENAPYSTWSVERRLQGKMDLLAAQKAWNPDFRWDDDSPWSLFESREENRDGIERWDQVCAEVAALFSPAFRDKLARDAESGKVIARYLFATWPPGEVAPRPAIITLEERLEWEAKARRYSALNLAAGEAAGMLAFSDTFSQALFTGMAYPLRFPFEVAAVECGYRPAPDRWVRKYLDGTQEWLSDEALQRAQLMADSLASLCKNRGTRR